jgi:hypothetical protein
VAMVATAGTGKIQPVEYRFPLLTEDSLRSFVQDAFGVEIPDRQVCAHHTTPWRAFSDAYFARSPVSVWIGSRGFSGKTFTLATLAMTEAMTLGAEVNILGGSGQQSQRAYEAMAKMLDFPGAPREMLTEDPLKTSTKFVNGASVQALTASQKSVRGPHPSRLLCDEVDEMDVEILKAAMGQPMRGKGPCGEIETQTVLSSTHQYEDGTMSQVLKWAEDKGWPVYEFCYRETMGSWLAESEVERKRSEIPAEVWSVEYDMQRPSRMALAIDRAAVEAMFDASLASYDDQDGQEITFEEPARNGVYAHGADWARSEDWTVFVVLRIDTTPYRVVAYKRQRRKPWPVMVPDFDRMVTRYPGRANHDGNGIGDVVAGYLTVKAEAVAESGRLRTETLNNYINAIERGMILSPYIRSMYEEHAGARVNDLYGTGHLPDSFQAGALAYRAATKIPILKRAGVW